MYKVGYYDSLNNQSMQKAILDSGHKLNVLFEINPKKVPPKEALKDDFICNNKNCKVYNADLEGLIKNSDFVIFNGQYEFYRSVWAKCWEWSKKYNTPLINLHDKKTYKFEEDRTFGKKIASKLGMGSMPNIDTLDKGLLKDFVRKHKKVVFKSNAAKCYTYIASSEREALDIIEYDYLGYLANKSCIIEEFVEGKELCIGAYFNGNDWVGDVFLFNQEYKQLYEGDKSRILTGEVGTMFKIMRTGSSPKLVQDVMSELKLLLQEVNYKGFIDLNCIKPKGKPPVLLEFTCREGFPTQFIVPFIANYGDFYGACAGLNKVKVKEGYYCAVCFNTGTSCCQFLGSNNKHHFPIYGMDSNCVLASGRFNSKGEPYQTLDDREIFVVGHDKKVDKSITKAYKSCKKIDTFLLQYRKDIGCNWVEPEVFFNP